MPSRLSASFTRAQRQAAQHPARGSCLSFSPTLHSLYIAISTEVLIAGDCVLLYVSQCTTVCWGLLCLHSGSIPAGFHHPGDPRYRPGSGADTCDTYATFYHQSNSLIFAKVNGFLRRRQLWRPASAVDKLWMHVYLFNLNFNAIATEMPVLDTAGSSFNGRRGSSRVHLPPIHDLVLAHPRNARPLAAR